MAARSLPTWYKMVHLLESGLDFDAHHYPPLIDAEEFRKRLSGTPGSGQAGKIILNWI